jgi:diketogulonate reductase-like aldo/keto reductase
MFKISNIEGSASLSNKVKMPYLGLGVYQSKDGMEVINAINWALEAGYRHIDTATLYENEIGVGRAVRESGIKRSELFITTKVWNSDQGYESTLKVFDNSLKKLKLDYIDLYLIHWPVKGKYKETWKAIERIYKNGGVKAIGVSNFLEQHLVDLMNDSEIVPMVNQVEFHPKLILSSLLEFCNKKNIQFQSWSPLMHGEIFGIKLLGELASKYNKDVAQLVIRWNLQKGVVVIPKSVRKERIISNANVFDFEISQADMDKIENLNSNYRIGADPNDFNF